MLCQSRNGHAPKPSMTSSASVPRNQRNAEPGKKNRRRNKKERRNRRMSDGHSRGLHNAEKLILPKKALVGTARGNRMHGLRRKRRAASVTFAGDSPHTTACGPTISSGGSEFDIAAVSIKRCRRCYYGDWREDRQWSALQGLEDCPGVLRS